MAVDVAEPFDESLRRCAGRNPADRPPAAAPRMAVPRLRGAHIELPRLVTTRPGCDTCLLDNRRTEAGARA